MTRPGPVQVRQDQEAARGRKQVAAYLVAQRRGREVWYEDYRVRVATVEREYSRGPSSIAHQDLAGTGRRSAPMAELFSLQDQFAARLTAEPDTAMHIPVV